jgi:ADP-ribosylglycohydrolase
MNAGVTYAPDEPDLLEPLFTNRNNNALIDRLLGCAYGQALGDAYGLSTEFETRNTVAHTYPDASKLIPFPDYLLTQHSRRWRRGDWTDDTDQWILLLDTLIGNNGDEKVFAKKLKKWIEHGYPELNDFAGMGLGANVQKVISFCYKNLTYFSIKNCVHHS